MECINLREQFGRRFRVEYEESFSAEHGQGGRTQEPWLMVILCRYGHIYPHGGNLLAASIDGHPNVAGILRRLPCCHVIQDGDFGELTVVFDAADFSKIAKIIRPRRRRQVTEAQRVELLARLRTPRAEGDYRPTQGHPIACVCDSDTSNDSEVVTEQLPLFSL
jgi:hypothetical protein